MPDLNEHAHGLSLENARPNAPDIFNALHSSIRQWGSSLKHNRISFFPATIPANTNLYHGTHTADPVTGMEWLAFEIEHAEVFARSRRGPPPAGRHPPGGPGRGPPTADYGNAGPVVGYLHIYRTSRILERLLYIDGMSAGKTSMRTLDSTDLILRNQTKSTGGAMGDYERAIELCALGSQWGIEGIIPMEAGFELILCNFTEGIEFVSAMKRPASDKPEGYGELSQFEYIRGLAARYQSITAGRVQVHYSSMVSAYFYPLNLTNPHPAKAELPRLSADDELELERVRADLRNVLSRPQPRESSIDWQGVVNMIVTRYADRLKFMASDATTRKALQSDINFLLSVFIDYKDPSIPTAIENAHLTTSRQ